ncbi:adenosyl cobinamide amidohydrolase, putative [Mycobacterium xenopi]|uniref:VOC domain-containing protein n=2 Tax=Mycobacterium xenopi TaxID=1789 RepID=A0AAD1H003_MYCXE|nr:hypothetical protein MYXE_20830 [Mycobacterium xenopi]SPX78175.1 adenosyl cobinamide amidohydrolase, putative [Mycobacterium xenopi]
MAADEPGPYWIWMLNVAKPWVGTGAPFADQPNTTSKTMAIMQSTAIQNQGSKKTRSRVSSVLVRREVERSGVSCEVILTTVADLPAAVNVFLTSPHRFCGADHIAQRTLDPTVDRWQKGRFMSIPAVNHVAITVRAIKVSGPWYRALFGADPVLDERTDAGFRHLVWRLDSGTLFGIHQHDRPAPDEKFSEFRVGLDHVGFGCRDRAELEQWARRLGQLGIEHGGIVDAHYGSGLSFRDPDGIALEFFAPPG